VLRVAKLSQKPPFQKFCQMAIGKSRLHLIKYLAIFLILLRVYEMSLEDENQNWTQF
jgi:hypothetical protein